MVSYSLEGYKRVWTAREEEENKIFSPRAKPTGIKMPTDVKPTCLNAEFDVDKWPLVDLKRLLRLYAVHCCLWDVGSKGNRNRKLRHAALIDITAALNIGVTKEQVVQKINILRATYHYEKKRIKQRIRRGLGARTRLKWFALADAFLRNVPKKGQKEEDPSNSDSDLEDTAVFTINSESSVHSDQGFSFENYKDDQGNCNETELSLKQEIVTDNSQNSQDLNNKPSPKLEIKLESQDIDNDIKVPNHKKPTNWTLQDSLIFLLRKHPVLLDNSWESKELRLAALEIIAKEMNFETKSIEKRWLLLQKTYEQEMALIKQNPLYTPKYKWWCEAQQLFATISVPKTESEDEDVATEAVFLPTKESLESSDIDQEYEDRFLTNPIPSVDPLSNTNEAMAALFHTNEEVHTDIDEDSNTNSSFVQENDCSRSTKFVWQGLEDDLLEGKWSLKHSVKFLRLYGAHRCLWNLTDPDYRSRPLRSAAIEDIAASMGHGLTASYVAKKIKIFRITYMQQRKRLLEATERGETPEILLKWFPLADSFLRPHIGLRSIKSDAKEMPQFDYQYVYANLNLIDPALLNDFRGKGTQNAIDIGNDSDALDMEREEG